MSNTEPDIEKLLVNDSFIRWIQGEADDAEAREWRHWLQEDPYRLDLVKEARRLYKSLRFEEEIPETISELNRLRNAVEQYEFNKKPNLQLQKYYAQSKSRTSYWASAAAIVLLLISVLIVVQTAMWDTTNQNRTKSSKPVYATAATEYGQIRKLTLWDGSRVVLSANSRLTYPKKYKGGNLAVQLEGEAYFSIVHKTGEESRTFTVQTSEGEVTVLGTKFNVNTRSEETEVVLEEGKVHLGMSDTLNAVKSTYSYTMKPGERALFSPQQKGINVQTTDPSLFTSWRNLEFRFHNTPLKEIAERVREFYGVQVEFRDEQLKDVEFSGSVTNKNFEVLLHGLRILLEIPITHDNDTIIFGDKK